MADPYIGEIRIFAGTFAPTGWSFCDGQLLPIAQNPVLYSVIETTYGGNGTTTMALPDLRGRAPMHPGTGPGLSARQVGEAGGAERVALSEEQMPEHAHDLSAINYRGNRADGVDGAPAQHPDGEALYQTGAPTTEMGTPTSIAGASRPHSNMQPSLSLHFIIALQGLDPYTV